MIHTVQRVFIRVGDLAVKVQMVGLGGGGAHL